MIEDIESYLRWFEGINRRAIRDIGVLPEEAEGWRPQNDEGERTWDIGTIVGHMSASRLYFASAYRNEGWIMDPWEVDTSRRADWIPSLERSAELFRERLQGTPNDWLRRAIELIDEPGRTISGWRVLMMNAEHDVHHRSQIDTYAGINGWPIEHIFGRAAEQVAAQRDSQIEKFRARS